MAGKGSQPIRFENCCVSCTPVTILNDLVAFSSFKVAFPTLVLV